MKHYPTCSPNYPEKAKDEQPQSVTVIPMDDNEIVQCNDCGAYEIRPLVK